MLVLVFMNPRCICKCEKNSCVLNFFSRPNFNYRFRNSKGFVLDINIRLTDVCICQLNTS